MATPRKVKHVVADTGAFIRNAPLRDIGEQIYTLPNVVDEIRDKATRQRLQFLPYQLEYRKPTPEDIRIVTEFSKKTGDYPSLSATDVQVLALTYLLEKENVGTKHIKTTPDTKIEINLSQPNKSQPVQIAGFYLGTEKSSNSDGPSDSTDVEKVTSDLGKQTLIEKDGENTSCVASSDPPVDHPSIEEDVSEQRIYSEVRADSDIGGHINHLMDDEEFPALSRDLFASDDLEMEKDAENTSCVASSDPPVDRPSIEEDVSEQRIYSEVRTDSETGGHDNRLKDDDEFPALSRDLFAADDLDPGISESDVSEECDQCRLKLSCDDVHSHKSVLPAVNSAVPPPRRVFVEVRDHTGGIDAHLGNESEFPSLSLISKDREDFPSLFDDANRITVEYKENVKNSAWTMSYAKMTREGEVKIQPVKPAPRVFHEGHVLPSNMIGEEEEDEEEDGDEEVEDDEQTGMDADGWITPSNIKAVKKQMGCEDHVLTEVIVGCLTTDFAMQNVLIQMGLNVISVDGYLIKKAKSYVLRCFACFKVTSKMEKLFCPHCGNHTLKRIAMTVNDDGTIKYFFSRRKKLSTRGLRQSLPTPKGGKHSSNPMLVEDQPMPHQRPTKKSINAMDVLDPDFLATESPFGKHDITSRAAQLGIMRRGRGQKHQTGIKSGRRK